jgi:hypothetical protein
MGTTQRLGDVNLASETFRRQFTDIIPLTEQAAALPDMQGSGQVRDLREAASLSGTLATDLATYASTPTKAGQMAQLDALLLDWANNDGVWRVAA